MTQRTKVQERDFSLLRGTQLATADGKSSLFLFLSSKIAQDAALWVALVFLLELFRGVMFFWFRDQMASGTSQLQIGRAFWTGLRFDSFIVSYFTLPLFVCLVLSIFLRMEKLSKVVRSGTIGVAAVSLALICPIDIGYFQEYHNQFDFWIWGLVFDDRQAIAITIWKNYPVIWIALGMIVLGWGLRWILARWTGAVGRLCSSRSDFSLHWTWRALAAVILIAVYIVGLRGGIYLRRPVQLKDSAVCGDVFLDKIVVNPFAALRYSINERRVLSQATGLSTFLPGGDILAAAHAFNPGAAQSTNLDDYLKRAAAGHQNAKPQSIYIIVGESYDSWAMQPKFEALQFCEQVKRLGRAGIMADGFVSGGMGTMASLGSIISGLPDVGLQTNYRDTVKAGVPTAIAPIFKRLGYKTRFFYGGYSSWQRVGDFCREQGFDAVYGEGDISKKLSGSPWGVEDGELFDFIVKQATSEPTFNVIMTTSYHPPFLVDVAAKGFPLQKLPPSLSDYHVTPEQLRVFGHLWYADRCIGKFADEIMAKHPKSLIAITGDHCSRRWLGTRPSLFERKAVPFVLYGPEILAGVSRPAHIAGAHMDIVPTLVELSAPKDFIYHAFGRNLLDPAQVQMGFGALSVITPDSICEGGSSKSLERLNGETLASNESVAANQLRYCQIHGLSWWRIMKGPQLPLPKKGPVAP